MAQTSDTATAAKKTKKKRGSKKKRSAITKDPTALPTFELSSIQGIRVRASVAVAPQADELLLRFEQLRRAHAREKYRKSDAKVKPGDEILVDFVGFQNGEILPHFARADLWLDEDADLFLPGLRSELFGAEIGQSQVVQIVLPEDYPDAAFRQQEIALAIEVKGARRVRWPDAEDPRLHASIGLGTCLDETMEALVDQLQDERIDATRESIRVQAAYQLARRLGIKVSSADIDAEIKQRWRRSEGVVLAAMACSDEQQSQALGYWLQDRDLRTEVKRVLQSAVALQALIQSLDLSVEAEEFKAYLEGYAEGVGADLAELRHSLEKDKKACAELYDGLLQRKAMDLLVSYATVVVD